MKHLMLSLVVLLGLGSACIAPARASDDHPTLKITTLDGKNFDLAAQRGKWVIVNFWATWCNPCLKEMPDISAFVASRKDVTAIGLSYEEGDRADIQAFVKKHPVAYPIAQVDVMDPPADFDEPRGLPTTYLIAPDGHLARRFVGPVTSADLGHAIAAAQKGS